MLAESRNRGVHETYRDDEGVRRCKVCRSTIYRHLTMLETSGYPVGYLITWICWGGGHEVLERWRLGSPVKGRFPSSDTAPTLSSPTKKPKVEMAQTVRFEPTAVRPTARSRTTPLGMVQTIRRTVSMATEQEDIQERDGCDMRCTILRYRDTDGASDTQRTVRLHSWEAHNAYIPEDEITTYEVEGLEVDLHEHEVIVDGYRLNDGSDRCLTPREFSLLWALARVGGSLVSSEMLLSMAWGKEYVEDVHVLRVNMARLRAKLDPKDSYRFIETVKGVGYRLKKGPACKATERQNGVAVMA